MTTYTVYQSNGMGNCGHKHKTCEAAEKCLSKLYDSHYVGKNGQRVKSMNQGTWTANANWHGAKIIEN